MWKQTSRTINQPMNVILSLRIGDVMVLLFSLGFLQVFALISGVNNLIAISIISVATVSLILFRYKHPKGYLMELIQYYFTKIKNGGVYYDPKFNRRKKV
jgi:hypothetical protein